MTSRAISVLAESLPNPKYVDNNNMQKGFLISLWPKA